MMQDTKALQAGTSHHLGQNFAKAFNVTFQNEAGEREHVWATSWGVSTRLIGALIMAHSDDHGLVLPPLLAPIHAVVLPIWMKDHQMGALREAGSKLFEALRAAHPHLNFRLDERDQYKPGWKFAEWEQRGVPVRVEIGPRDLDKGECVLVRRDTGEKESVPHERLPERLGELLVEIQQHLFDRAKSFRDANTHRVDTYDRFKELLEEQGGFYLAHWDGTAETEARVKEETKATIRCIPFEEPDEPGACMVTGKPSRKRVLWARAY
jgi:prolyl-tRNA synthetase